MGKTRALDLKGPAGRLEAVLMTPNSDPVAAAVVCHAHPLYGGMMHHKVVYRAAKVLQQGGLAVLRFNFRGVGRSEGRHDQGRGEQDDARAALDGLEHLYPELPLVLGGFSFGAEVALRVGADDPRVVAVFALGFAANFVEDTSFMDRYRKPVLFVQGEQDAFGPVVRIREIAMRLPQLQELVVVPGTDHFFNERLGEMDEALSQWLESRPWTPRSKSRRSPP